jgi:hypothetical protein
VVEATNDCTNCDQASSNGDQGQQATGGGCCGSGGGWDVAKVSPWMVVVVGGRVA